MLLMLRLTGRTHIYSFILVSELIYAFSIYIVNLELSFKVLKSKFRTYSQNTGKELEQFGL